MENRNEGLISLAPSLLPGHVMASVEELKQQLAANSDNVSLVVNILTSLINKVKDQEKIEYLKQKISILIKSSSFHEAETDMKILLQLDRGEENLLLFCNLLHLKKDYLNCMTQLLKLRSVNKTEVFEKNIEELSDSDYFHSLFMIPNLPDLYNSQITFFPELRGKVVLQICSSDFQTYILISTCPHLAYKTDCPSGLYNCSEELQLLEISDSILEPIDFLSNQKLMMVSCSDLITAVLHRSGRITVWGELPESKTHIVLENPCSEISVGGSFICMVKPASVEFWGKLGEIDSTTSSYDNIILISQLTGSVQCSSNHILLLSNSDVYSFGIGEEGQLGLGSDTTSVYEFSLLEILSPVTQVLCNDEVSVAFTKEIIVVWGMINPLQLNSEPPISWRPVILDSFDLEHVSATLGKFEMLVLGKDALLYSWIWKEDNKLKKYRKLDVEGICMISLRGTEAFLVKKIAIPQLTQIINISSPVYSGAAFFLTLALHDQYGVSFIPDAEIMIAFSAKKKDTKNVVEFTLKITEDDCNTIVVITPFAFGEFWLHVYVEKQEIMSSPMFVNILPSPTQEEIIKQMQNIKKLEAVISSKKQQRFAKRQEERAKAVEEKYNKMERTRKRAQEALKTFLEEKEEELIKIENKKREKIKKKTGHGYVIPY